jgi:hypothetical protein
VNTLQVLRIFGPCGAAKVCEHVPGTANDINLHFAILEEQGLACRVSGRLWDVTEAGDREFKRQAKQARGASRPVGLAALVSRRPALAWLGRGR